MPELPRIRQVVVAARDLDAVAARLQGELELGEPFSDPGVGHFGLRNAVFPVGNTFIEVVSPVRDGTSAGRLLDRRGGDCGYMIMFQVGDLPGARERLRRRGIREVLEIALDDIDEVHLHPADMRGAIVSLSAPRPPESWRWGGPDWVQRSVDGAVRGVRVAVADPDEVSARWREVVGEPLPVEFVRDADEHGLVEVTLASAGLSRSGAVEIAGVRFVVDNEEVHR